MTVAELIAVLGTYPEAAEVTFDEYWLGIFIGDYALGEIRESGASKTEPHNRFTGLPYHGISNATK